MSKNAWEDFEYWLDRDKAVAKKIRRLIKEIQREPFRGIGKPEPVNNPPLIEVGACKSSY